MSAGGTTGEAWALQGDAVRRWAQNAKPGEELVYAKAPTLHALRHSSGVLAARELFDEGIVTFKQKRLSPLATAYIAERRSGARPAPQRRIARPIETDVDKDHLASLMRVLRAAATAGHICPANREIGKRIGDLNADQAAYLMRKAQSAGLIQIEAVGPSSRIVTIKSSGKRTAYPR